LFLDHFENIWILWIVGILRGEGCPLIFLIKIGRLSKIMVTDKGLILEIFGILCTNDGMAWYFDFL
jgi:hypothetical protein